MRQEFRPTADELETARILAAFRATTTDMSIAEYERIVEFLAVELHHETAEWKNAVMFHLTGASAVCRFKD